MSQSWPMIGRSVQIQAIDATLATESKRGVVLVGAAGVGKTRLAREAVLRAERAGSAVLWVVATDSARGLPYGAFAGALPHPVASAGGSPQEFIEAVVRSGRPVVIGIDDAHLLDPASAVLVHQLGVRGEVSLILTVRAGGAPTDTITALWKDDYLDRLEVPPLTAHEVHELLQSGLGGPVQRGTSGLLWSVTHGNPMFLRLLVDGELDAGQLRRSGGWWHWPGRIHMTSGLQELVDLRMGEMSAPVALVVDLLSVTEPLELEVMTRLASRSAIEDAEAGGLVLVEADKPHPVRLAHPLYGESRRITLGPLRARRLRTEIVANLLEQGRESPMEVLRLAMLALDADVPADADLFSAAAEIAAGFFDPNPSLRLAKAAIAAGGGARARVAAAYAAGVLDWDKEPPSWSDSGSTEEELVRTAATKAAGLAWNAGQLDAAEYVLADAGRVLTQDANRLVLQAFGAAFQSQSSALVDGARSASVVLKTPKADPNAVVVACLASATNLALVGGISRVDHSGRPCPFDPSDLAGDGDLSRTDHGAAIQRPAAGRRSRRCGSGRRTDATGANGGWVEYVRRPHLIPTRRARVGEGKSGGGDRAARRGTSRPRAVRRLRRVAVLPP